MPLLYAVVGIALARLEVDRREGRFRRRTRRTPCHRTSRAICRGCRVREIRSPLLELYGLEVSPELISTITDEVLAEMAEWQALAAFE